MRLAIRFAAFASLFALAAPADAGKFNKTLSIGDAAPTWEGLEGTDGKKHALADLKDSEVVVVVFTCNSCPVAEAYEDRIIALAKANPKAGLVAVNVNTGKDDALPAMKQRAAKKKFPFPYVFDPSQEVARKYGAKFTPEFFVLNKDRKVVYMGAMDDKSPPADATVNFLEQAVAAAMAGKDAPAETLARGCKIRFNMKRDE